MNCAISFSLLIPVGLIPLSGSALPHSVMRWMCVCSQGLCIINPAPSDWPLWSPGDQRAFIFS